MQYWLAEETLKTILRRFSCQLCVKALKLLCGVPHRCVCVCCVSYARCVVLCEQVVFICLLNQCVAQSPIMHLATSQPANQSVAIYSPHLHINIIQHIFIYELNYSCIYLFMFLFMHLFNHAFICASMQSFMHLWMFNIAVC